MTAVTRAVLEANAHKFEPMLAEARAELKRRKVKCANSKVIQERTWRDIFLATQQTHVVESGDAERGMWTEPRHKDGGGSCPHGGATGYGERDVQFFVPGAEEPLIIQNTPGTFYMGLLTGCEHQVYHVPSAEKLSRFGLPPSSLSVMIRCDLFGRQRLRRKKAPLMANPAFRICIKIFREHFLTGGWRLPSIAAARAILAAGTRKQEHLPKPTRSLSPIRRWLI